MRFLSVKFFKGNTKIQTMDAKIKENTTNYRVKQRSQQQQQQLHTQSMYYV